MENKFTFPLFESAVTIENNCLLRELFKTYKKLLIVFGVRIILTIDSDFVLTQVRLVTMEKSLNSIDVNLIPHSKLKFGDIKSNLEI